MKMSIKYFTPLMALLLAFSLNSCKQDTKNKMEAAGEAVVEETKEAAEKVEKLPKVLEKRLKKLRKMWQMPLKMVSRRFAYNLTLVPQVKLSKAVSPAVKLSIIC